MLHRAEMFFLELTKNKQPIEDWTVWCLVFDWLVSVGIGWFLFRWHRTTVPINETTKTTKQPNQQSNHAKSTQHYSVVAPLRGASRIARLAPREKFSAREKHSQLFA